MVALVGARGVGLVEVDAFVVNTADEQGGAEGARAAVLGEGLLEVADFLHQDVHGDGVRVRDAVDLGFHASTTNELAGVGDETGGRHTDVLVDLEHLLDGLGDDQA